MWGYVRLFHPILDVLQFHHRDPGLVGLLTSLKVDQNPVFFGIIADGYHTHETVLRIAFQANPRGKQQAELTSSSSTHFHAVWSMYNFGISLQGPMGVFSLSYLLWLMLDFD